MSPDYKHNPKTSETNKKTTNFLTLPRELRHRILLYTDVSVHCDFRLEYYSPPCHPDPARCCSCCKNYQERDYQLGRKQSLQRYMENATTWARQLRKVDTRMVDDVDYVEKIWVGDVKALTMEWGVGEAMGMINENVPLV